MACMATCNTHRPVFLSASCDWHSLFDLPNIVAADSVDIVELAYTVLTCYALLVDEITFGEAVLRHGDNREE